MQPITYYLLFDHCHPDIVKYVTNRLHTRSIKRFQHRVEDPAHAAQFNGKRAQIRLPTPDGAEGQDGEVDAPVNSQWQATDKRRYSVAPEFAVGEQLKENIDIFYKSEHN